MRTLHSEVGGATSSGQLVSGLAGCGVELVAVLLLLLEKKEQIPVAERRCVKKNTERLTIGGGSTSEE